MMNNCSNYVIGPDIDEILEIHDEERSIIERLEELLVEFDLKYQLSSSL